MSFKPKIHSLSVLGGYDIDGAKIFVGRAAHDGMKLPAKIIEGWTIGGLVCWNSGEHKKWYYEMLLGRDYEWVDCTNRNVPTNAVDTNQNHTGGPQYVGRGHYRGSLCVGRIQPPDRCLYIPFGFREVRLDSYEVLIYNNPDIQLSVISDSTPAGAGVTGLTSDRSLVAVAERRWVRWTSSFQIPVNAVECGYDIDGAQIYVGRALHEGVMCPATVIPRSGSALVGWNMRAYQKSDFEMLIGQHYVWMECSDGNVPSNAVSTGKTSSGEVMYIGRGCFRVGEKEIFCTGRVDLLQRCLYIPFNHEEVRANTYQVLTAEHTWLHATLPLTIPQDAILGGHDVDGEEIYVGRVFHDGVMYPANIKRNAGFALVGWNRHAFEKWDFQWLVGQGYGWVSCGEGYVPPNAVSTGKTRSGDPVYIGRGCFRIGEKETLCVGRVDKSDCSLYIPFGGREEPLNTYEVLICMS